MNDWKACTLGDAIELKRGYDLPSSDRDEGSIPIVSSSGITDYHNVAKKVPPGVVTGRYGTIGEVFYVNEPYWPLNTTLYVRNFRGNEPRFIAYFLKVLDIKGLNAAGAVPGVNRNHLHKIKIKLPPLPTQRKIAAILSAYDDLIENNLRRIALLEELARETYAEWFVRLRFPGWEGVAVDGGTGLPVGWTRRRMSEVCKYKGGGTPSTKVPEYWEDGNISWFSPTDLTKASSLYPVDSARKITQLGLIKSSAKLMQPESFMMSSRATIGLFAVMDKPFATNQGFINITPKKPPHKEFLLYNLMSRVEEMINFSTGSTFLELTKSKFALLQVKWPTEDLLRAFSNFTEPKIEAIIALEKQNELLREARDLLLPRLMGGVVEV